MEKNFHYFKTLKTKHKLTHKKLLLDAFNKAKIENGFNSKSHVTQFLSDYIQEDCGEPYGERILRNKYNDIISNKNEVIELRQFAAESLRNYLGYEKDVIVIDKKELKPEYSSFFVNHKMKLLSVFGIIIILLILIPITINTQRWMVWNDNHYVEVEFDLKKYNANQIKAFNEARILNFTKINPDCETQFFKENGLENLWYGKNHNKTLDFFTSAGLHPHTGKTLKPITVYMIKKYICPDYK